MSDALQVTLYTPCQFSKKKKKNSIYETLSTETQT